MLIGGYQSFSLSDFPGKTAAIVFTQGCNFRCPYCHNKTLWPMTKGSSPTVDSVLEKLRKRAGQLDGVVITGGEPTLHADLKEFILAIRETGLAVKLDTNGSNPLLVQELLTDNLLDFIAMDIKAPPEKYSLLAGTDIITETIEQSLMIIQNNTVPHLFRTTYDTTHLDQHDLDRIKKMTGPSPHIIQRCRRTA